MLRKMLAVITLGCLLPIQAHAASWALNTWVKSRGGSISVRGGAAQTSVNGPIFKFYTTHSPFSVTVTADPGYSIRNVTLNSAIKAAQGTSYTATVQGMAAQSVLATFAPTTLPVTARVTSTGGSVTPTSIGNITYGFELKAPLTFYFTPKSGFFLNSLSGAAGGTVNAAIPAAPQQMVTVTYPKGYVINSPINLSATFTSATPVVSAGLSQTAVTGDRVTLTASTIGGPAAASYSWSQVSGPSTVALAASGSTATFTAPQIAGYYVFRVAANGDSTAMTSVTVSGSSAATVSNQCIFCHKANNIGPADLYANWSTSLHRANRVTCDRCHIGVLNGGHPGTTSGNICLNCHFSNGDVSSHPFTIGASVCTACHNPHSLAANAAAPKSGGHFNNSTSAGYPASYVTSRIDCVKCHANNDRNQTIRKEWEATGHAAVTDLPWSYYDFKTKSGCVQCHTSTGFIAYSTGKVTAAWGSSADKTKEVLACAACHSDVAAGTVRKVAPVKPFAGSDYRNRDAATSNICFDCHSGTNDGSSIQARLAAGANFGNLPFVPPHYLAAGATLHGNGGYHFPGQSYAFYSSNSHRSIGLGNTNATGGDGPCVACHMTSSKSHSWKALAEDGSGNVTGVAATVCANCHLASLDPATLNADKTAIANSLEVLRALLADHNDPQRSFAYSPTYPYFSNTDWGADEAGANMMGAAFNYKFLLAEPGVFAHNGGYARKLLLDSIDAAFNNGTVTGSVDTALSYLLGKQAITQSAADAVVSLKSPSNCASCHPTTAKTTGSHAAHLRMGFDCSVCHYATASSNGTLVPGTVLHANGKADVFFAPTYGNGGRAGYNSDTKTCSLVYCHSDGNGNGQSMVWGSIAGGGLTCLSCHPVLSQTHTAHLGDLFVSGAVTFYNFTANRSTESAYRFGCSNCHPTDSSNHMNGRIDLSLAVDPNAGLLKNRNAAQASGINNSGSGIAGASKSSVTCSAAYCHSNGAASGTVYASTPDWYNPGAYTGDRCAMCHGNSPNAGIAGSSAHGIHVVGIHALNVYDGTLGNLPAGSSGNVGHGDAAQSTTLNCNVCHNATVTSSRNDGNTACAGCHAGQGNNAAISVKKSHVNGRIDVVFANISIVSKAQIRPESFSGYTAALWTRNGDNYKNGASAFDTSKFALKSRAVYDGAGGCSNVACHLGQPVKWSDKPLSYCSICHNSL